MSSDLQQMTEGLQTRIRYLAYLMWESAGRQQGMAMEYWLKAESEVMSTLQAAARMLPGGTTKSAKTAAEPGRSVSAGLTTVEFGTRRAFGPTSSRRRRGTRYRAGTPSRTGGGSFGNEDSSCRIALRREAGGAQGRDARQREDLRVRGLERSRR